MDTWMRGGTSVDKFDDGIRIEVGVEFKVECVWGNVMIKATAKAQNGARMPVFF